MSKTLTEIAQDLKNVNKKVQLIYAFNGTGKTRLSREFKELIAPKNEGDEIGEGDDDSLLVSFQLTDYSANVDVRYEGILPDLFGEGQGAVASGVLSADGTLMATEVLAKHDENYMPPEVAEALEQSGYDHQGRLQ